ncbi:MAG: hypothetical protein PHS80_02615 [Methanothrix sp.]|nr:hypothetical protein [Methanothrix sp.]
MSLKFTKEGEGKIIAKNEEYQTLTVEGVICETGVLDGIYISPESLKSSSRWLNGRPIKLDGRKVGQIDEVSLQGSSKLAIKGQLMTVKLSQSELYSLVPEGEFTLKASFFPITKPQDGAVGGESFKEVAKDLQWEDVILEIKQLKGHAADSKWEKLEKMDKAWDHALGRR